MAKNLKLTIKNTQIAKAINLSGLKSKLSKKKEGVPESEEPPVQPETIEEDITDASQKEAKEEAPRIKARSKSAFAEKDKPAATAESAPMPEPEAEKPDTLKEEIEAISSVKPKVREPESKEDLASSFNKLFIEPDVEKIPDIEAKPEVIKQPPAPVVEEKKTAEPPKEVKPREYREEPRKHPPREREYVTPQRFTPTRPESYQKLGPTGKHIKDLMPPSQYSPRARDAEKSAFIPSKHAEGDKSSRDSAKAKPKPKEEEVKQEAADDKKGKLKFKEFKDVKPTKKTESSRFDVRDRQGLRASDDDSSHYRKKRGKQPKQQQEDTTIRPTNLSIRVPITVKDLAAEMKLKTAQLIGKLFLSGVVVTINDILEDTTTIQLLGQEFGCEIHIDTSEEERIRITDKTIDEEVKSANPDDLVARAPIVAFMGHVDHGKTSLIDAIRKSNRAAGEAGAITQHIGAFRCHTPVGDIAILDTPGHEAFSSMRERGAHVTDIVVLVVAGDEGIKVQTVEAIQHAKTAGVNIVVAINKSDKPNFNAENVYRQLAEQELLPEAWGGEVITVNCSATTGEGIPSLLEMLALQAEVLELKANPKARARGTVLESEMHKGLGGVATILVQNGTIKKGDALVCDNLWGRVKTMFNEFGKELLEAGPSTPVEITGLSGLPDAGQEFIVVKNEKEAKEIAEARAQGQKQKTQQMLKKVSVENMFQQASETSAKKVLNLVLRADVQGSLEAVRTALLKIHSKKIEVNLISAGVGEVSESDVQLAAASKATIIGFHTQIESHADSLIKQLGIQVRLHDIIYHAIDDVKAIMVSLLDKIAVENERGRAEVRAVFKSSQHGMIAGCIVTDGTINRNHQIKVMRNKQQVWKGSISSLKRVKEDVREVAKGLECGILLSGFNEVLEGDILEAVETTYITQEL